MNLKNISFKKLLTQGGLALATLLSRLLEGCIALASMVYKLLRYALKVLWAVFIFALLIIPYGIFRLYQGYKNRKNAPKKEQEQIVYTGNIFHRSWQWLRAKPYQFYLKCIGIPIGIGVAGILLLILLIYFGAFGRLPSEEDLKELRQSEASLVYDYENQLIGKFYIFDRTKIEYKDFPPYLINALIATEDERFYLHGGVDTKSLFRVFFKSLLLQDDSSGGGSTVTMQLAKNIYGRGQRYGKLSMPIHKIKEMIIARRIEKVYSKEEILTLYLNTVPFSDNTYGIESAAQRFFDKSARDLTLNEAATLIGTLKATNSYNPRTSPKRSEERRNVVLAQMKKNNLLTEDDFKVHTRDTLKTTATTAEKDGVAPYLVEQIRLLLPELLKDVKKPDGSAYNIYKDGLRIYTTIDKTMQEYAEKAVEKHLTSLQQDFEQTYGKRAPWNLDSDWFKEEVKKLPAYKELEEQKLSETQIWAKLSEKKPMDLSFYTEDSIKRHSTLDSLSRFIRILNTGFVSVEPQTGAIKTYVGGADFRYFKYDHILQSRRQVGSVFKPIVYATALEMGMPVCTHFSPLPLTYADYEYWSPRNASKTDDDPNIYYSVCKGLRESLNTIAVQTLFYAGLKNVIKKTRQLGITSPLPNVPSIALGSAELSVIEVAKAYTAFANKGVPVEPYFITRIENKKGEVIWERKPKVLAPALSERTAQIMIQMMRSTVNEGTASRMRGQYGLTNDLAGKTGTTQDNKDGWFAGMLPNLVMITWVGNDQQIGFKSTRLGQGANSALPIAALFVSQLNRNSKYKDLTRATFKVSEEIRTEVTECEPTVREGFFDRLLSSTAKDTIRAGDVHYRIYERKGKLHNVEDEEDISVDDVVNPANTPAPAPSTQTATQEGKEKKKGLLDRIFSRSTTGD